ncbi:MAG: GAF domain-containing protein [Desulfobulbaceae bacterium]
MNTAEQNQTDQDAHQRLEAGEAFYRQTLADILAFSTRLTRNSNLASLYRESNALARKILKLDYSTLMIVSDDGTSLVIRDAIGFPSSMINTFFLLKGQGLSTYVATEKKAAVVEDFQVEKRFEVPPVIFQQSITSAVAVPMMLGDNVFGVMIGHTRSKRLFSPEEIDLYQSIANQSAVAIKNTMHFQSLQDSEKRFRTLIDRAGDAIFLADMNGKLVDVNKMACQALGYSREELLSMSVAMRESGGILSVALKPITLSGNELTVFATPQETLARFREQPDAFDLVVTDMTMPKMTGMELAKKIMEIRQDIPIILCTGFSDLFSSSAFTSFPENFGCMIMPFCGIFCTP